MCPSSKRNISEEYEPKYCPHTCGACRACDLLPKPPHAIKVWHPEGEDEPDHENIEDHVEAGYFNYPDQVASEFAEKMYPECDYPKEQIVAVRMSDGVMRKFIVSAEQTVEFHTSEIREESDAGTTQK